MTKMILLFNCLFVFAAVINANEKRDYGIYHQRVIEAEKLIASENFDNALLVYEQLFDEYDFVFVREYQIAAQLALYVNNKKNAIKYLKQGILSGWEMKSIKKNKYLDKLRKDKVWQSIESEYPGLNKQYESNLNQIQRERVKKMYSRDQKKAIKALLRFSSKAQDNYAEKKFAPHSLGAGSSYYLLLIVKNKWLNWLKFLKLMATPAKN